MRNYLENDNFFFLADAKRARENTPTNESAREHNGEHTVRAAIHFIDERDGEKV